MKTDQLAAKLMSKVDQHVAEHVDNIMRTSPMVLLPVMHAAQKLKDIDPDEDGPEERGRNSTLSMVGEMALIGLSIVYDAVARRCEEEGFPNAGSIGDTEEE